jgi:hypothetical protein
MKITKLLSNLITENARLQVLFDKYVKPNPKIKVQPGQPAKGIMDFDTLKTIIFSDPDTKTPENFDKEGATIEEMSDVKVGKYVQWMLKNYVQPKLQFEVGTPEYKQAAQNYRRLFIEDIEKMGVDLLKFERFKGRLSQDQRDINKLTPEELNLAVDDFKLTKDSKSAKEERITKENPFQYPGSNIEIVTPNWTVVKISDSGPDGRNAAGYFGGYYDIQDEFDETSWCTSKLDGTYFEYYLVKKPGPLYVILPNNATEFGKKTGLPKERYQFHFPESQFMNRRDRQIDLIAFLNGPAAELKEYFKPQFITDFTSNNDEVLNIVYTSQNSGNAISKYVALYGFDDLFDNLPTTFKRMSFQNRGTEALYLNVPPSIAKFKDLEALTFENFIKELPKEVCELKNLALLALPNNKDLQTIPECLVDLPELSFITLKNCPNLKVPPIFKERMNDEREGTGFLSFSKEV